MNFQMFKQVLEKAKEPEIKLPTSAGSLKRLESSRKTSTCALLTTLKPLTLWIQIGKGIRLGCILLPCLFNLNAEYIMQNAGLDEAQAGIKIAGRNITSLKYADDTTHMAESEEELQSLLIKVKEESEKVG